MNRKEAQKLLETWPVRSWKWPRVVAAPLQERAMSHADEVMPGFWGMAIQGVPLMHRDYGRTDVVRNKLALQLLESDFTHILMMDIDHKHPLDLLQRLVRWVLRDPEDIKVVGALNFRRGVPYEPCCFILKDGNFYAPSEWEQGLIEVDAIGTGAILISREVFEQIEPPWFVNDYTQVWKDIWPGEDMGFSAKCRKSGIKMWVDTTTTCPHMIDAYVDESSFRQYLEDHDLIAKYGEKDL